MAADQSQQLKPAFKNPEVSLLIPVYNEESSLLFLLNKIKIALIEIDYEMVIVDDGSTDQSAEKIETFIVLNPHLKIQFIRQTNLGKGGAIRTAIRNALGRVLVVQDADLEYEPEDIIALLEPFKQGEKVVYGSRNMNKENREHSSLFFYWGGILVTKVTNFLFSSNLTDEATGYKLFEAELFNDISFKENDFAWEPEVTAQILKRKIKIVEKPIQYHPRTKNEGKKISWKDGLKAIFVLFKEYFKK